MKADADYHDYLQDVLDATDKVGSVHIRFVVTRLQNIYRARAAVKRRRPRLQRNTRLGRSGRASDGIDLIICLRPRAG